ncbi:MAG: non-canonical purine NTP pyrophosphatase [Candidatus Omnitrophota bacterium]|nr:MAG: non-canonical purine NTP pyrophosphatase [Candidatus Omnitrophota bacterium]
MKIVISTRNKNKFKEISRILKGPQIELASLDNFTDLPLVVEDRDSFADNAAKKALTIAKIVNNLTVADDSGLMVDALSGEPGVYSARFSGQNATYASNNKKLLELLKDVPFNKRTAQFVCCVAIADARGVISIVRGTYEGIISTELKGENGFGYDPLFIAPDFQQTFAQLSAEVKNRISHRAKAFIKAKKIILDYISQRRGGGLPAREYR